MSTRSLLLWLKSQESVEATLAELHEHTPETIHFIDAVVKTGVWCSFDPGEHEWVEIEIDSDTRQILVRVIHEALFPGKSFIWMYGIDEWQDFKASLETQK